MTTDRLAGQRPRRTFRILEDTSPVAIVGLLEEVDCHELR